MGWGNGKNGCGISDGLTPAAIDPCSSSFFLTVDALPPRRRPLPTPHFVPAKRRYFGVKQTQRFGLEDGQFSHFIILFTLALFRQWVICVSWLLRLLRFELEFEGFSQFDQGFFVVVQDMDDVHDGASVFESQGLDDSVGIVEPEIGMSFGSEEEVRMFYSKYAMSQGFGIAKISVKCDDNGSLKYYSLAYSRNGKYVSLANNGLNPRPTIKIGCKAKINIVVRSEGEFVISKISDPAVKSIEKYEFLRENLEILHEKMSTLEFNVDDGDTIPCEDGCSRLRIRSPLKVRSKGRPPVKRKESRIYRLSNKGKKSGNCSKDVVGVDK
ncbi:hypothetical protein L1049_014761 [Liquidambar formosana]|uniref:FAR1 domain-containing protein n=1 Tax=Liquidambar formosana TaxID=63359 RepID=A0AAP0S2S1_LIQFO